MNTYFIGEESKIEGLLNFFDGQSIKWKLRPLDNGYLMVGAKMNLLDKMLYKLIFTETRTEFWSRLKTV